MRSFLFCLCLLAAVTAGAATPSPAPSSAANLLRLHPGPWRLPVHVALSGMRFDPETGEVPGDVTYDVTHNVTQATFARDRAALRARAEASVRTSPDGSQHLVSNGALLHWMMATVDDRGRLVQDCVHSEEEA